MTDTPAAVSPGVTEWEFPSLPGKRSFDVATIPSETRLELLKNAVRGYIANRLNSGNVRYDKDPAVAAWAAYDAATKADALQTAVPQPAGERPASFDAEGAYSRAITDLMNGHVRKRGGDGEAKPRVVKDPLVSAVTDIVVREVFNGRKATDPKFTFLAAKAEVGGDGIAYLNKMIAAKVAAGANEGDLIKVRDNKYINPAKTMLGLSTSKAMSELPSIL